MDLGAVHPPGAIASVQGYLAARHPPGPALARSLQQERPVGEQGGYR